MTTERRGLNAVTQMHIFRGEEVKVEFVELGYMSIKQRLTYVCDGGSARWFCGPKEIMGPTQ